MMHTVVGDGGIVMLAISDAAENDFEETGFNWFAISSTCKVIPPTTSSRCSELAHAAVILTSWSGGFHSEIVMPDSRSATMAPVPQTWTILRSGRLVTKIVASARFSPQKLSTS